MPPKPETVRVTPKKPRSTPTFLLKRKQNKELRLRVLIRDEYVCQCCKQPYPEYNLECDHIIPLSKGGEDTDSNCQTLCVRCHAEKTKSER